MRHPFYLLRASIEEIEEAARQQEASPDFDAFVDELKVTPELKEWMKKNQTVTIKGDDFLTSLTPDDVLDISEFRAAYIARNLIMVGLGFPKRKAKLTDREKNPEKWAQSEKRYEEELRSYAILHPESFKNMDDHLLDITADVEWRSLHAPAPLPLLGRPNRNRLRGSRPFRRAARRTLLADQPQPLRPHRRRPPALGSAG
jgi:hypothetical protein